MSYLNPTRLHFAGLFRADVSTINNDDKHFDSSAFAKDDQKYGPGAQNGWWQPSGTGAWRMCACSITGASWSGKFATKSADDPVVGLPIRNSGDRVDAKLVDLDPDQQMVSMIFGLDVRIVDPANGAVLMSGQFKPAAFMDLWTSRAPVKGPGGFTAYYQSTITNVIWGDISKSPALRALRAATVAGQLSMRFMVDAYNLGGPRRGYGRLVGTIGPVLAGEPTHFVPGRHLASTDDTIGNVTCCVAADRTTVLVDLGNAFPMDAGGKVTIAGDVHLLALKKDAAHTDAADVLDLGAFAGLSDAGHYEQTAGIHTFPAAGSLTNTELQTIESSAVAVARANDAGVWTLLAVEASDGIFARADDFVLRMNPGDKASLPIFVTRFGKPHAGQTVVAAITANSIGVNQGGGFPASVPANALAIQVNGPTDVDGKTILTIDASDPGKPRGYLDGQVYEIDLSVNGARNAGTAFNPMSHFISILLFSETQVPATVTWAGDVLPILQQYANLYPRPHGPSLNYDPQYPKEGVPPPLLHPVLSLTDKDWVGSYAARILTALALPIEHPNHMPVTRDLSAGRRGILETWMHQVLSGTTPPDPIVKPAPAVALTERLVPDSDAIEAPRNRMAEITRIKSGAMLEDSSDQSGE